MKLKHNHTVGDTEAFVEQILPRTTSATVVTLSGGLGAGKTTFAQQVAKALGVEETVTSPTYVIEKVYKLENQPFDSAQGKKFERFIHIDAYRLKSAHELEVLGWKELLADAGNLILLEWPEKVEGAIPEDAIRISFEINGEERIISINGEEGGNK